MYICETSFSDPTVHMIVIHINDDQHEDIDAPDETLSVLKLIELLSFLRADLDCP